MTAACRSETVHCCAVKMASVILLCSLNDPGDASMTFYFDIVYSVPGLLSPGHLVLYFKFCASCRDYHWGQLCLFNLLGYGWSTTSQHWVGSNACSRLYVKISFCSSTPLNAVPCAVELAPAS